MIRKLFAGFALASLPVFAGAAVLTVEYATSVSSAYNWGTRQMQAIAPITGSGSFTYDLDYQTAQYSPSSVRALFGKPLDQLGLISPGTGSVPFDPANLRVTYNQLLGAVTDSWSLYTDVMASMSATGYDAASASQVNYNWRLYWTNYDYDHGAGDGSSAYLLSTQDVVDTLRDLVISGAAVTVQEGYSLTRGAAMSGLNWTDQKARITRVFLDGQDIMAAAAVPTPATYALLLPGLMLLGAAVRRRKTPASATC